MSNEAEEISRKGAKRRQRETRLAAKDRKERKETRKELTADRHR
jgi:hypothetical protein